MASHAVLACNVDTSDWDCPCEVEDLEEWIIDDESNCDVCSKDFQAGTTFFGNRDEDWDVCDFCYHGKAAPQSAETADSVDDRVMQSRLAKINLLEAQRITERDMAADASSRQMLDPNNFTILTPGLRIAAYFKDEAGDRSKNVTLGQVLRLKNATEVEVTYDNGLTQIISKEWVTTLDEKDEEYLKEQLDTNKTDWTTKVDTPFHLRDVAFREGSHKLKNVGCQFGCGYTGLKIGVAIHERRCRRNPHSCLWAGGTIRESVPALDRTPRVKAKAQPTLQKWGAGHRMWQTMPLEQRQSTAKFNLKRLPWKPDASTQIKSELTRVVDNTGLSQIDKMNAATFVDNNDFLPVSAHKDRMKRKGKKNKKKKLGFDQPLGKHTGLSASGLMGEDLMMGLGKGYSKGKLHTPGSWNQN